MLTIVGMFAIIVCASMFTACSQDDYFPEVSQDENIMMDQQSDSYVSTRGVVSNGAFGYTYYPNPNLSYAYANWNDTHVGYGGTYYGGLFKASLIENNGAYYIRFTPYNNATYLPAGDAYVKIGSLYGGYGTNHAQITSNQTQVDVPITVDLNSSNTAKRGVMNLWPMIRTNISGSTIRLFSNPIMLWTSPMYTTTNTDGVLQGYVDNVYVRKAVNPNNGYSTYQCVQFCRRYYSAVFGKDLSGMGDACDWPGNADDYDLTFYVNGTSEPQVGDIVCWSGGDSNLGHVAIIIEVQSDKIKMAHQNGGSKDPIGFTANRTGASISNPFGDNYTLEGLIRRTY